MITYPLNNIDYTAEDAELFHCTRTSGIWAEDSFPISVTGADNNVTVGTGIAWINNEEFSGKVTALKTAKVLDMGIADGVYPRIDIIAIQYSANNNATDVVVKKGTPATNPVQPAIVRSGAVYELYLASVYRPAGATVITASNITDLRMNETVCGLMADSVTKVDMTAIEAQVRNLINNLQNEIDLVRDLSGIMFESEWVEGDVIPVSKGGTGANTAEEALANLGGVSKKLLWTNASSTSSFAAQTISLDLSDYDEIEIKYMGSISWAVNDSVTVKKGEKAYTSIVAGNAGLQSTSNTVLYLGNRTFTISDTGVVCSAGYAMTSKGDVVSSANNICIPLEIYGIKGVQ